MTIANRMTGYAIEGMGLDASYSGGVAFHASHHPQPASSDYEWVNALTEEPQDAGRSLDPIANELRTGGYTLRISASDRIAALLGAGPLIALYRLGTARSAADTTLVISGASGLDGQVVWLGDEAVKLGSSVGTTYSGCTRGYWGTKAQSHEANARVWDRSPKLRERVVRRVRYDRDAGTEEIIWRGFVSSVVTSADGTAYLVELVDVLQSPRRASVNRNAQDLAQARPVARLSRGGTIDMYTRVEDQGVRVTRGASVVYLQVGPLALKGFVGGGLLQLTNSTDWLLATSLTEDLPHTIEGPWWPLFLIDRLSGEASTSGLSEPYHPITIALALLMSSGTGDHGTYDILDASWGLGLTDEVVDVAGWEALRASTPDARVDHLVLGWDGQQVQVWDVITRQLLSLFGIFVTQTATGQLGVAQLRLPTLAMMAAAPTISRLPRGPLQLDRRLDQRVDELTARIGALPWREGRAVTVRNGEGQRRRLEPRSMELDYSVMRPETLDMGSGIEGLLAAALVHMLVLMLDAAPRLHIHVADEGVIGSGPLALGDSVQVIDLGLAHDWLVGEDGVRIAPSADDVRLTAMVVGLQELESGAVDVQLSLLGWRLEVPVRERAPSGLVSSWDLGTLTHTIDSAAFSFSGGDGLAFDVGDEVTLWDRQGALRTTNVRTLTGRTASTLTIDSAWSVTPVDGDVVRLADSTLFTNTTRYPALTDRPYAFLGDSAGEFEDNSGDTVVDNWGTNTFTAPGDEPVDPSFVAVDDDAVMPASSGVESWALDAWLGHRLRENASALLQDGSAVSWQTAAPHGGDTASYLGHRPHCSFAFTTLLCIPWLVQPDLEELTVALVGRVATESGETSDKTAGAYDLRLQLDFEGVTSQALTTALLNSESDTPVWQPYTATLSLNASRRPRKRGIGRLMLWGRGGRASAAITQSSGIARLIGDVVEATSSATLMAEGAGSRPNSDSIEVCGFINGVKKHDALVQDPPSGSNPSVVLVPATDAGVDDLARHHLDYLQYRGAELRERFADLSAPPASAYAAHADVTSERSLAHALRVSAAHARARCVYVGPPGVVGAGSPWPTGYGPRWPRVDAQALTTLLDAPLYLDRTGSSLIVMAYVLPSWCLDLPAAPGESVEDLAKLTALVPWEITATLEQLEAGDDWSTAASRGGGALDVELTHWPTVRTARLPALTQEWYLYNGDWTYREGQLFDADLPYLQLVALAVDVDSATDLSLPMRLRLQVEADTASATFPEDMAPSHDPGTPTSADRVRMALVGCTVWEVP